MNKANNKKGREMKFDIGGHNYNVNLVESKTTSDGKMLLGHHDTRTCTINLDGGMSKTRTQETFLHEIVHVILTNAGMQDHDETMIDATANGLLQLGVGEFLWKKLKK